MSENLLARYGSRSKQSSPWEQLINKFRFTTTGWVLISTAALALLLTRYIEDTSNRITQLEMRVDELGQQYHDWIKAAEAAKEAEKEVKCKNEDWDKKLTKIGTDIGIINSNVILAVSTQRGLAEEMKQLRNEVQMETRDRDDKLYEFSKHVFKRREKQQGYEKAAYSQQTILPERKVIENYAYVRPEYAEQVSAPLNYIT